MTAAMNEANAFITERTLETLSVQPGEHLLEIDPGNGLLSLDKVRVLGEECRYVGFEYADDTAECARETANTVSTCGPSTSGSSHCTLPK